MAERTVSTPDNAAKPPRCEPPAELRAKDGYHWVTDDGILGFMVWRWSGADQAWVTASDDFYGYAASRLPDEATSDGYRYVAPIPFPTEEPTQ